LQYRKAEYEDRAYVKGDLQSEVRASQIVMTALRHGINIWDDEAEEMIFSKNIMALGKANSN
jgi:hypothetical protein